MSDDLLKRIKAAIPYGHNPNAVEDIVSDIALLVVEGRIDPGEFLTRDIGRYFNDIKRKYALRLQDVSLDHPVAGYSDSGSRATLKDVLLTQSIGERRKQCELHGCRARLKSRQTRFCSKRCAGKALAASRTLIDRSELAHLHRVKWMPLEQIARLLGVTRAAVRSTVTRHGMSRALPKLCRVDGCGLLVHPIKSFRDPSKSVGTLCLSHKREQDRAKSIALRVRRGWKPMTQEQISAMRSAALKASWARRKSELAAGPAREERP